MIEARYYQNEALDALYQYFMSNSGNPLIGLPTGTGKSLIPAIFIHRVMQRWPNQRFLLATHVSELIKQNAEVLKEVWDNAPLGIYSAGLKQKESAFPIVFGGIQSMIKNPAMFGHRDIAFVDEAHLISQDDSSMYQTFFACLKLINPRIKIIGLTATLYRMGQGYITDGGLFTDIVYDKTNMEGFNELLLAGYLSPLIPLRTDTELDVSNVGMQKGEFIASQLQAAVDKQEVTYRGLLEVIKASENRRSRLLFASGIEHAEHIAEMLCSLGIQCAAVHSKKSDDYNTAAIKAFKEGSLPAVVNFGKLTTGFNHPNIDFIGMFRPTMSVPLWVQMLGRGTRPADGKSNCLVMDFARNTPRLGPINDPIIPKKKGEKAGEAPIKLCEQCGAYNHASVRFCCQCGSEFHFAIKIVAKAGTEELIKINESDLPVLETFDVKRVIYVKNQKIDHNTGIALNAPYITATYFCGTKKFKENVFPEHKGYAKKLFQQWWMQRNKDAVPETVEHALQYISQLRVPKRITVWTNKKPYPEIRGAEW